MSKWNINARGQGFSVLRNGREIRNGETLGVHDASRIQLLQGTGRFLRGFGRPVQCQDHKSRFSIDNEFRKYLIEILGEKIEQIKSDYKEELSNLNSKKERPVVPLANHRSRCQACSRNSHHR